MAAPDLQRPLNPNRKADVRALTKPYPASTSAIFLRQATSLPERISRTFRWRLPYPSVEIRPSERKPPLSVGGVSRDEKPLHLVSHSRLMRSESLVKEP